MRPLLVLSIRRFSAGYPATQFTALLPIPRSLMGFGGVAGSFGWPDGALRYQGGEVRWHWGGKKAHLPHSPVILRVAVVDGGRSADVDVQSIGSAEGALERLAMG